MATLDFTHSAILDYLCIFPGGLGFSSLITSILIALISCNDRSDMAVSTGASYLFRYTGQTVGVGISAAVLQGVLGNQLRQRITGTWI